MPVGQVLICDAAFDLSSRILLGEHGQRSERHEHCSSGPTYKVMFHGATGA